MSYARTPAIALRCTDFSETSQVVAFITPDYGQVHALAKGSRRPRRDGRMPLDILTRYDLVIARRPPGRLHILADWSVRETFDVLRRDVERLWAACHAAEVVLLSTSENPDDGPAYGDLLHFLRALEEGEAVMGALVVFMMRTMRTTGSEPVVDRCARCRGDLRGPVRFSPAAGGALCGECGPSDPAAFPISLGSLAVMSRLAAKGEGKGVKVTRRQAREIMRAFHEHLQYHLGRALRTARFVSEGISASGRTP